jgi:hypothetical protein
VWASGLMAFSMVPRVPEREDLMNADSFYKIHLEYFNILFMKRRAFVGSTHRVFVDSVTNLSLIELLIC